MRFVQAGVMILGAAAYLGVASVALEMTSLGGGDARGALLIFGGWNALLIVVTALVIIDSVRKARAGRTGELARDLFVVKLAAIPFFLMNFGVLASVGFLGSSFVGLGALFSATDFLLDGLGGLFGAAAIAIALTYLAMLTTSTYGWATIAQLRRDGRINAGMGVLYRLMLLVFVADVVAAILLYAASRRAEPATNRPEPIVRSTLRWVQAGTLLLGAVMYGLVIAFSGQLSSADSFHWLFFIVGGWNTLWIVVTGFVARDSLRKVRAGNTQDLATDAFVVKVAGIPFFVLNFFALALLGFGGLAILLFGGPVLIFAASVGSALTYLTMLSTSVYAWGVIARMRRERVIGTGLTMLYTSLSLLFVTDVMAGILLFGHSRRRPGFALVIVGVAFGLVLVALGLTVPGVMPFQPLDLAWLVITGAAVVVTTTAIGAVRRWTRRSRPAVMSSDSRS